MTLKTKQTLKIFEPFEDQIIKLAMLLNNNSENSKELVSLKKLVLDQLYKLAEKFDSAIQENVECYKDLKKKIATIIEEFCTIDFNKKDTDMSDQLSEKVFTTITEKFLRALENLEKSEVLIIKQSVEECLDYVKDMGKACEIEDLQNIKELGTSIVELLQSLQVYKKNLLSKLLADKLALFCCQLYTSFSMLVQVIKEQHQLKAPVYTCKKYVCDRMCLCFESILFILDAPNPTAEEECFEQENNFVYRIDLVLDMISSLSNKSQDDQIRECNDIWLGIEDIFAHAMSIAQVCQPYNFKAISGSCQTILTEYENLKRQLHCDPPDQTMNNLFITTLTDSLYRLERKINISVLTLVMEVFSDTYGPLKKLIKICGISLCAKKRSKNDLSEAIEEFDQLTDKSVQIGKFAIACCRDKNRVAKVKNCLASFESLETELVPAITAFYLHPDNKEMRSCVKLLTAQWQAEMDKFHDNVDLIIDPSAYCQIVLDDLQERINEMSQCLDDRQDITINQVQTIVQKALSLSRQIKATVTDVGQENIDKQTIMLIREFKVAIFEADAASKKFLVNKATPPEQLRVIKRCEILLKLIKTLLPALSSIVNNLISMNTVYNKSLKGPGEQNYSKSAFNFPSSIHGLPFDQKSSVYIRTPYSVKSYKQPLSIQAANTVPRNESDVSVLIPYIEKGRQIRTEWSIMYKTPKSCKSEKQAQNNLKMKNLSSVRQHLFSRDSFMQETEMDFTAESLDLTNILEQITDLSDTLSSVANNSVAAPERPKNSPFPLEKIKNMNKAQFSLMAKKFGEISTSGGGDAPVPLSNLEKIRNTKKKINKFDVRMKL